MVLASFATPDNDKKREPKIYKRDKQQQCTIIIPTLLANLSVSLLALEPVTEETISEVGLRASSFSASPHTGDNGEVTQAGAPCRLRPGKETCSHPPGILNKQRIVSWGVIRAFRVILKLIPLHPTQNVL